MDVLEMTIKEVIEECEKHYCCGDCPISKFCNKNFDFLEKPHKWRPEGDIKC